MAHHERRMRKYLNKPMEELATELSAGLLRLRKSYVDAAEALGRIIEPATEYPYEFIVYRLTGYRGRAAGLPGQTMIGRSLRSDLQLLALDICDSFALVPADYSEPVLDCPQMSRQFHVSLKTIQRWQKEGLFSRRVMFTASRRRLAFLESSIQWFIQDRQSRVMRSMKFSQMTPSQRNEIIRRARRMARFTKCSLGDITRRLASRTGRAAETIRYTIRKYDKQHPESAIFPYLTGTISQKERDVIYHSFLSGVAAPELAGQYGRTRGSIYRIVNEKRAREMLSRTIDYVYNQQFDLPNADELFESAGQAVIAQDVTGPALPDSEDAAYFKELYTTALLDASQERDLFRCYNYLKYKADKLRRLIDLNRINTAGLKLVESLLLRADLVRSRIVRANLRLVVSIAKKHVGRSQSLLELISDGNVSLLHAVEKFDYSRGYRFSTYASWAIMRNFARSVSKERYQMDRFATTQDEVLDVTAGLQTYDPNEVNLGELRESLDALMARLSPRERTILTAHYGLDEQGQSTTFDELGKKMGISKERVRQIETKALGKLREIMNSPKE
jgi:RNA polymerase primary sigma factor